MKPLKAIGTRWIDHRIRAMGRLDDKVGLYARHMKSLLTRKRTRKQKLRLKETEKSSGCSGSFAKCISKGLTDTSKDKPVKISL